MKKNLTQKIAVRAMLIAVAFVLSWVEAQLPYPFPVPGMKLGLSNFVVLFALYRLSEKDALFINIVRIVLVGFTFSNTYALIYSLAGGMLSFIVMLLLKKFTKSSMTLVSVAGGISHNLGQIIVATLVLQNIKIMWYLPFLWISGIVAGIAIGLLCRLSVKRIPINLLLVMLLVSATLSSCGNKKTSSGQFFAMDTYMTIDATGKDSEEAVNMAGEIINRLDELWSVGLHNSEMSQLNQAGSLSISQDTQALLKKALSIQKETCNALDLTVYPLMKLWGFATDEANSTVANKVPSGEEINQCLKKVCGDNILLDEEAHSVTLLDGATIDLGAVAKGYTTDKIVELFHEKNISSANINLGGNVYVLGYKSDGSLWNIAIENPDSSLEALKDAPYLGIVSVHDKAIVTSGDYHRYFIEDGVKYHHIMDPATGSPSESGLISVTIVASDATLADGLSTALFVMGREKALDYWADHSDSMDCILVEKDGSITISKGLEGCFKSDLPYEVYPE